MGIEWEVVGKRMDMGKPVTVSVLETGQQHTATSCEGRGAGAAVDCGRSAVLVAKADVSGLYSKTLDAVIATIPADHRHDADTGFPRDVRGIATHWGRYSSGADNTALDGRIPVVKVGLPRH